MQTELAGRLFLELFDIAAAQGAAYLQAAAQVRLCHVRNKIGKCCIGYEVNHDQIIAILPVL